MRLIDAQYLRTPFYGSRQMTHWLQSQGYPVNRKRVLPIPTNVTADSDGT